MVLLAGCSGQRWEGDIHSCSDGRGDQRALLLLQMPPTPMAQGWFGTSAKDGSEAWTMTELANGKSGGNRITFEAVYDGPVTENWSVDVYNTAPNVMEGTATVESTVSLLRSTHTFNCRISLKPGT